MGVRQVWRSTTRELPANDVSWEDMTGDAILAESAHDSGGPVMAVNDRLPRGNLVIDPRSIPEHSKVRLLQGHTFR